MAPNRMQMPRRPVREPSRLREIDRDVNDAIARHSAAGFRFEAGGVRAFARQQGDGADVVMLHGVPTSSFLYRRVLPVLADQGLRGTAFDFPGLGLSDRPAPFNYSWSGLAAWTGEAIDALGLDRVHLVVHDIGGPIGLEWAIRNQDRVLSITVLNTVLDVAGFKRPWPMRPFAVRGLGELWLRASPRYIFSEIMYSQGIADRSRVPRSQVYAHIALLRLHDRGRAFLEVMRGFELTEEKERFFREGLANRPFPVRAVWGEDDPALGLNRLEAAKSILGLDDAILLPAKHFLQEDHFEEIGQAIADLAAPLG
ncbi:MAG: alpha/beta fold hydrolase [Actinomycetota bacterium]|nr:alpha/beta fold hydrolase [Actinomycetota bacterium]